MDLSDVDAGWPQWQKYDRGWAARAARGVGVRGGPKGTPTAYFRVRWLLPVRCHLGCPVRPDRRSARSAAAEPSPSPSEQPVPDRLIAGRPGADPEAAPPPPGRRHALIVGGPPAGLASQT